MGVTYKYGDSGVKGGEGVKRRAVGRGVDEGGRWAEGVRTMFRRGKGGREAGGR